MTEEEQTMLPVQDMSREQRRRLIASVTECITDIIDGGGVPILVAVTPAGPGVYGSCPEDVALRVYGISVRADETGREESM